jgi:hypothetical protein
MFGVITLLDDNYCSVDVIIWLDDNILFYPFRSELSSGWMIIFFFSFSILRKFTYFRRFSKAHFCEIKNNFSRKCENENIRFNPMRRKR